jgi:hypothetical protein
MIIMIMEEKEETQTKTDFVRAERDRRTERRCDKEEKRLRWRQASVVGVIKRGDTRTGRNREGEGTEKQNITKGGDTEEQREKLRYRMHRTVLKERY